MTAYKPLRITNPANCDLTDIFLYTRRQWGKTQARKYLNNIRDTFATLRMNPGLGVPRAEIDTGLRAHTTGKHIVFYRETKTALIIVRVLHERMDITRYLSRAIISPDC